MGTGWHIVAFPLIIPWRKEFWTLPLYFADLKVGVTPGWPEVLPFQAKPLPPEALAPGQDLRHYHPGELLQQKAFKEFLQSREEVEDIIRELKGQPREEPVVELPGGEAWSLVWQLEKMQADQETQMIYVDQGQEWLAEILAPEPWDNRKSFGTVPGLKEMVDPELAELRYLLWRREMGPYLRDRWAPLLLGRTSRAIFGSLKDWPGWNFIKFVQVNLPGVRSENEWREFWRGGQGPEWRAQFEANLTACLQAAGDFAEMKSKAAELNDFLKTVVAEAWPGQPEWYWDLEIWAHGEEDEEEWGPVLCWVGAGSDIMPG